jgi:phytoene dehydrogenase-like protein
MSDSYYNVVVVGTELSGLIAAAILAKKNYRVLVLGYPGQENEYQVDGMRFVRRPSLFSGFDTSAPIKRVFAELSLSIEMQNRPKPLNPFYQVVMPDRRIDVVDKERIFRRELSREFPGDQDTIRTFYRVVHEQNKRLSTLLESNFVLPVSGFRDVRAWRKLVRETIEDGLNDPLSVFPARHPFRSFAVAPLLFSSGCQVAPYSVNQLVRTVNHMSRGLYSIADGLDGLKNMFIEKVKANCGDYRARGNVERFTIRRGRVREVQLRERREIIGCDMVICNMDVKRFFNLFPEEHQKERYHLSILELQPTHVLYTLNIAVRSRAIPESMGNHVFLVRNPAKPLEGNNIVLLTVDPAGAQPDKDVRTLAITSRLPIRHLRPTLDNLQAQDDELMRLAESVVPFLREHFITRASAWVSTDKRTQKPHIDTTHLVPIYGRPTEDTLDASPISPRTAYKNVVVGGDHLHSGLGLEGAFLGGLNAAQLVTESVSRKALL